jgi:hypothetical protein
LFLLIHTTKGWNKKKYIYWTNSTLVIALHNRTIYSTKEMTILLIGKALADMGTERLGFKPEEFGTHLIRSNAAMAVPMAGVHPSHAIHTAY